MNLIVLQRWEKVGELEDGLIDMIQFENYREKEKVENVNRTSETYNIRNLIYIYVIGVTEGEERENGVKNSVEK